MNNRKNPFGFLFLDPNLEAGTKHVHRKAEAPVRRRKGDLIASRVVAFVVFLALLAFVFFKFR